MKVLVLGTGCTKCRRLEEKLRELVERHQLPVEVGKVTDLQEIMRYGILSTPGLVVDGVVMSAGMIPKDDQLLAWMRGAS